MVVNKIDQVGDHGILTHLTAVIEVIREASTGERRSPPGPVEYFPVSAATGKGVEALV